MGIVDNLNCNVSSWNLPFSTHLPASISTKLPKRTIIGMFRSLSNLYKNSWKCFSGKNAAGAARANFTITVFKRWFFNIYHSGSRRRQCQLAFVPWWCSLLLESCFLGYQTELLLHTNSYIYRVSQKKRVISKNMAITTLKSIRKWKSWCVLENSA